MNIDMKTIVAVALIQDNIANEFIQTMELDEQGQYKVRANTRTTQPGQIADFPHKEAAELIAMGAARELTESEVALHQRMLANKFAGERR